MKKPLLTIGALTLGAALLGVLLHTENPPSGPHFPSGSKTVTVPAGGTSESKIESMTAAGAGMAAGISLQRLPSRALTKEEILVVIDQVMEVLRKGDPDEIREALLKLDGVLAGTHHDAAAGIAAIMEFLKSGRDARTGQAFIVGGGGMLTEATTLRVKLMDRLGGLSREAGSAAAALEVAREVLGRTGSADEWALSMRNMAWLDPDSRDFLAGRVTAMLQYEPWRQNPSQGMLEAFDLIVHTGALNNVPELSRLIAGEDSSLGRAASVALDRLAATRPLELTTMLNQQPELLAGMPLLRADLVSRVDLGDTEQRRQAEDYLARPDITPEEREKFLFSLIQKGQFISHNLTTTSAPPENEDAAGARMEVLAATVSGWLQDERFAAYRAELIQLGTTVNQIDDEINADLAR